MGDLNRLPQVTLQLGLELHARYAPLDRLALPILDFALADRERLAGLDFERANAAGDEPRDVHQPIVRKSIHHLIAETTLLHHPFGDLQHQLLRNVHLKSDDFHWVLLPFVRTRMRCSIPMVRRYIPDRSPKASQARLDPEVGTAQPRGTGY